MEQQESLHFKDILTLKFQKPCGCGTRGHELAVALATLGQFILEGFSDLSNSVIP